MRIRRRRLLALLSTVALTASIGLVASESSARQLTAGPSDLPSGVSYPNLVYNGIKKACGFTGAELYLRPPKNWPKDASPWKWVYEGTAYGPATGTKKYAQKVANPFTVTGGTWKSRLGKDPYYFLQAYGPMGDAVLYRGSEVIYSTNFTPEQRVNFCSYIGSPSNHGLDNAPAVRMTKVPTTKAAGTVAWSAATTDRRPAVANGSLILTKGKTTKKIAIKVTGNRMTFNVPKLAKGTWKLRIYTSITARYMPSASYNYIKDTKTITIRVVK